MPGNIFKDICSALKFTSKSSPSLSWFFFEVQQKIVAWNDHIQKLIIPSCVSWFYESMSIWMNKFIFPGFVFCSLKTHPKGKKYYSVCCSESCIVYGCVIVKGRDSLLPMGRYVFNTSHNIKTFRIMLQLTKLLWITG